ncbi:acyl-CoA dehydrogenase [Halorubellus sp. JP-L1]|uniref:acyl-CoA dehydrogenase family protein n=1 Tax=Halorubellus sp. JP-L1 TaxID=2715753 RepID=UPI001407D267|nr:acyl-CoA dehydrogenase family protein [Halorubellus sp. JP-L1]NHN40381.1 acyl-CoA dehydrogenase [Halorubellus sp. JP-L1]
MTGFDYADLDRGRHVNYYAHDPTLQRAVARVLDGDDHADATERLDAFGEHVGHTIADHADYVDDHGPELRTYGDHGDVVNDVRYPAELHEEARLTYESGTVADVFDAPDGRDDPLPFTHHFAMGYLLSMADAGLYCPVSMTAGVALVLDKYGDGDVHDALYAETTSRDYDALSEGAMFLTEEQGGSDVGATETEAVPAGDGTYRLTGEKWFCSNIDAQATLALARTPDAPEGTKGLSLFVVPHELEDGTLNDQLYRRLKDKLGTISVPTGEVELTGATGYLVGEESRGFAYMTDMLNLERLANAAASCGILARSLLEAKVQAANREAFGNPIQEYPLMRRDLVDMAVDHEAATAFVFDAADTFDTRERADDDAVANEAYRLMRVLVPIAKYRTGRMAVDTASYAMEILGGNGYVNDFVTNRLLRDAQVLPIWEGTSNVLSLDVLRALDREDAHEPLLERIQSYLDAATHDALAETVDVVRDEHADLGGALAHLAALDADEAQLQAKDLADYVFDVYTASLLCEMAQRDLEDGDGRLALVARRFVDTHLGDDDQRGITDDDRFALDRFDAVVRHHAVDPDDIVAAHAADD